MSKDTNYRKFGLIVTIIAIISSFLFLNHKLNNIDSRIMILQNHINTINDNNNLTISYLKSDIEKMLKEQNQTFFDEKYSVVGYDNIENLAEVKVSFSLKEFAKDSTVFVKANDTMIEATETSKGSFDATIKMDPDKETAVSYIVEGDKNKSQDLFKFTVKDELRNRFKSGIDVQMLSTTKGDTNPAYININIANVFKKNEKLKIKDCNLLIYDKNTLVKTVNLMEYLKLNDGVETIDMPDFNEKELLEAAAGRGNTDIIENRPISSITIDVTADSNIRAECEITDNLGIVYTFNEYN